MNPKFYECWDPGEEPSDGREVAADGASKAAELYAADFYPWDDLLGAFYVMVRERGTTKTEKYSVRADVYYRAKIEK